VYYRRGGDGERVMFADLADGGTVTELRHHTLKKVRFALSRGEQETVDEVILDGQPMEPDQFFDSTDVQFVGEQPRRVRGGIHLIFAPVSDAERTRFFDRTASEEYAQQLHPGATYSLDEVLASTEPLELS